MNFEHLYFLALIIPIAFLFYYTIRKSEITKSNIMLIGNRFVIASLMVAALASPFMVKEDVKEGEAHITLLVDNSTSMELYGRAMGTLNKVKPGDVKLKYVSQGNKTALGDAIFSEASKGENIILFSDGNNNYGRDLTDVATFAAKMNVTIHAIHLIPEKSDVGVKIEGNKKVLLRSEAIYNIILEHVGNESSYKLEVTVDDKVVISENIQQKEKKVVIPLKHIFNTEGIHEIKAEIFPTTFDQFAVNNVFFKSIYVVPKPKILFVSDSSASPLAKILDSIYDFRFSKNLENIENYDVVFLNDVSVNKTSKGDVESLKNYVGKGNGLVAVGGTHAFEKGSYRDSLLETLLPVKSVPFSGEEGIAVVIVIDISGSTGSVFGNYTKADVEKAIAVGLMRSLLPQDSLGVIAFNTDPYVVIPFAAYSDKHALEDRVARLQFGGGTVTYPAQAAADDMIGRFEGSKNVAIVSDGNTEFEDLSLSKAKSMATRGIKTYTVGVGYDTNEAFLEDLAKVGNGMYFKMEENERLKFVFGRGVTPQNVYAAVVVDKNHFITQNLELSASVYGYNDVTPKAGAQLLVATLTGKPIVTAWRFGLGRVVSLTTDDGTKWSSQLYVDKSAKLISTITNWVVGDPEKTKAIKIDAQDVSLGDVLQVIATSSKPLGISAEGRQLKTSKIDVNKYRATFKPEIVGFYDISADGYDDVVAANYPAEFISLGFNENLFKIVKITGGKVYELNPESFEDIAQQAKAKTRHIVAEKIDMRLPFLLTALTLFFIEVVIRRIKEIQKMGRA
ncbi:MAG: VWA domain-containing protein [Euryarchaeota archaeon]|nr:VWA domain-containing protein [Euryarchaeota archaeon]